MVYQKKNKLPFGKTNEEVALNNFYKANIIQPLKGFCTTVEEGNSISKAARKLYISPSTISKQIASLENKLNIKLFYHKTENLIERVSLELTDEGKEFYEKAKEVIERTDGLVYEFLKESDDDRNRTLNITTNSYIFQKLIPAISEFKESHKDYSINIDFFDRDKSLEKLLNDETDLCISSLENNEEFPKAIKFIELSDYIPYWVLYKGHPLENKPIEEITQEEILKNNFIFNDKNISMKSLKKLFDDNKIKSSINFEDCGVEMEKKLIKSKMGIWLIFDIFLNKSDTESLVLKNAKYMFPCGKYGCFINKHHYKKILKEFIDFLVSKKEEIFRKFS